MTLYIIISFVELRSKKDMSTYQRAVAAKHMVLPTYIGSRRTLKGNLIDKTNELDLKNSNERTPQHDGPLKFQSSRQGMCQLYPAPK